MILFLAVVFGWLFPSLIAALAAWDDIRFLNIPNKHALVLLLAFPFVVWAAPQLHFVPGFLAAMVILLPGLVLFILQVIGAGDIKLASVMALYIGFSDVDDFLLLTGLFGGGLAVIALFVRHYRPPLSSDTRPRHWIDRLRQGGRDLPYGVALAAAFIVLLTRDMVDVYLAYPFGPRG